MLHSVSYRAEHEDENATNSLFLKCGIRAFSEKCLWIQVAAEANPDGFHAWDDP